MTQIQDLGPANSTGFYKLLLMGEGPSLVASKPVSIYPVSYAFVFAARAMMMLILGINFWKIYTWISSKHFVDFVIPLLGSEYTQWSTFACVILENKWLLPG